MIRAGFILWMAFFSFWGAMLGFAGGAIAQETKIFILKPINKQKILPGSLESLITSVLAPDQTAIRVRAGRGEYEPASFVIRAATLQSDLLLEATDLVAANGASIPRTEIDINVVKCWYQGGTTIRKTETILVPELLLKDDTLVKVDETTQTNYLKVGLEGQTTYIDISSPTAVFPANATINDALQLQPFSVPPGTNKQIWITLHVPANAPAGEYKGELWLKKGQTRLKTLPLVLEVLPYDLSPPMIAYGLYYRGRLTRAATTAISSEAKTAAQYTLELENMRNHGVVYPAFYQSFDEMLGAALDIRKSTGLPTDNLYAIRVGSGTMKSYSAEDIALLSQDIARWKEFIVQHGYQTLYTYGKDEARSDALVAQRPAWEATHAAGAKVFVAGYKGAVDIVGDLLDLIVLSSVFKPDEVAKWHQNGKKVFIYGNPQVGVEDPEIYRRNYGVALVCNGYDGVMDYAYQHVFGGHIWNDFDHLNAINQYRDHVFAYPTSNGVVDTVEWEGFREAIDDVRYFNTLISYAGESMKASICSMVTVDNDLDDMRTKIMSSIKAPPWGEPGQVVPIPENLRKKNGIAP